MPLDPSPERFDQSLNAPLVEYLGIQPARDADDRIVAVLTFRFLPAFSFVSQNVSLTKAQALRLCDDLQSLTTDADSWLYIGKKSS
jgi:hypothetical protein